MIDGLRRKLESVERARWDIEQELQGPEMEVVPEARTDTTVLLSAAQAAPGFSPGGWCLADYCKSIVKAALQNGGKYGDHQIPTPWLKMILAGLEGRHIEPETMWYAAEPEGTTDSQPGIPSYDDLFPSDRDVPAGLR